jgi:hypothetical protein
VKSFSQFLNSGFLFLLQLLLYKPDERFNAGYRSGGAGSLTGLSQLSTSHLAE